MRKLLREIVDLPECECLTLIAGKNGLDHPVRWTVSIETTAYINFIDEDDLIIVTGIATRTEEELLELVSRGYSRKASGIVFAPGPYIPSVPQSIVDFGNSSDFPVLIMPWEVKISSLTFAIGAYLLKNTDEFREAKEILKSIFMGREPFPLPVHSRRTLNQSFQKNATFRVLLFRIRMDKDATQSDCTKEEEAQLRWHVHTSIINEVSHLYAIKTIPIELSEGVAFLLEGKSTKEVSEEEILEQIVQIAMKMQNQFPGILPNIGLGNSCVGTEDIGRSYKEAELVTELFSFEEQRKKSLYCYGRLGVYRMISESLNPESLEQFCKEILGVVESSDALRDNDYITFLHDYFEHNGNISEISRHRYLHRNTILYKMKKIEKLMGFNFCSLDDLLNIKLALLINDILNLKIR